MGTRITFVLFFPQVNHAIWAFISGCKDSDPKLVMFSYSPFCRMPALLQVTFRHMPQMFIQSHGKCRLCGHKNTQDDAEACPVTCALLSLPVAIFRLVVFVVTIVRNCRRLKTHVQVSKPQKARTVMANIMLQFGVDIENTDHVPAS